jgi:hypothetical protein
MSRQYAIPRQVQRQLRSLGKCWRPVVIPCGLKEWSDREIGRLRPAWVKEFLRRHVWRCSFLTLLYLMAFTFLGASFERYWHWVTTVEAVAGEPVTSIDKWKSYCVVKPWSRGCKPALADVPGTPVHGEEQGIRPLTGPAHSATGGGERVHTAGGLSLLEHSLGCGPESPACTPMAGHDSPSS